MSVLATRVERLTPSSSPTRHVCWRCGIEFDWSASRTIPGSPCRDCRETLAEEGDTTVWNVRRVRRVRSRINEEEMGS